MWKLLKINLARKYLRTYKWLVSGLKKEWSVFVKRAGVTNLVQCIKNRIFDVITNKGDFIMHW